MKVEFEWQSGGGDEQEETIARTERRKRFRLPRWVRRAALIVLIVATVGAVAGYGGLRLWYARMRAQAWAQIEQVMEVERQALASGDGPLYLAQQDEEARDWYRRQEAWVRAGADDPGAFAGDPRLAGASIEDLELRGDVAWVEVVEGPVRRARFYRRVAPGGLGGSGWRQTAPRAEFWGVAHEAHGEALIVRYAQRDEPYVQALFPYLEKVASAVAEDVRYSLSGRKVILTFAPEPGETDSSAGVRSWRRQLSLPSPWVSGVPADGVWDREWLASLAYEVAHALAQDALRSSTQPTLNPLQRAVADEYAAWVSHGRDGAQAPLLGRAIERRGREALPMVFLSLKSSNLSALFMAQWISIYPSGGDLSFFETLLNVEREALLVGRKETFLLFQAAGQRAEAAAWYERERAALDPGALLKPVRVAQVEMAGELARVTVRDPASQWDAWRRCRLPAEGAGSEAAGRAGASARACQASEWWDWMRMQRVESVALVPGDGD